jgi:hypothetical protein
LSSAREKVLGKEGFADELCVESSLSSATLGKAFAECFSGFVECFRHSAKPSIPVVIGGAMAQGRGPALWRSQSTTHERVGCDTMVKGVDDGEGRDNVDEGGGDADGLGHAVLEGGDDFLRANEDRGDGGFL